MAKKQKNSSKIKKILNSKKKIVPPIRQDKADQHNLIKKIRLDSLNENKNQQSKDSYTLVKNLKSQTVSKEQSHKPQKKASLKKQNKKKTGKKAQNNQIHSHQIHSNQNYALNQQMIEQQYNFEKKTKKIKKQNKKPRKDPIQKQSKQQTDIMPHKVSLQSVMKLSQLTAKAFGIYNQSLQNIQQYRSQDCRKVASIAKLMTLLTHMGQKWEDQIKNVYCRITLEATKISGSSAQLLPKQWMTVHDLFYGLMLPSGNDAAVCLSQNFGALITQPSKWITLLQENKQLDVTNCGNMVFMYENSFVEHMNKIAKSELQMFKTNFTNPHGLDEDNSYSTVRDIAKLLKAVNSISLCSTIMNTKKYSGNSYTFPKANGFPNPTDWINTNNLLWKKCFTGGKTGQTPLAGNCLASIFCKKSFTQKKEQLYYVIVLGCQKQNNRFKETQKIISTFFPETKF